MFNSQANYETKGNWCAVCEAKASVLVKSDISWFIKLAQVAKLYEKT